MLTTDLETVAERSVLQREKNRIVVLMKQKAWTLTEEVLKFQPAKEPIRVEEEETREADLEADQEDAVEAVEEEDEVTDRDLIELNSLSELTTYRHVVIGLS